MYLYVNMFLFLDMCCPYEKWHQRLLRPLEEVELENEERDDKEDEEDIEDRLETREAPDTAQ